MNPEGEKTGTWRRRWAVLRMFNLDGQVVVTKPIEVGSIDEEGLKLVEKAQNEVLAQMNFKGYCKVEPMRPPWTIDEP